MRPFIVCVSGASGSGKSTIVEMLAEEFSHLEIAVLHQDHYFKDLADVPSGTRQSVNFDHPDALDLDLLRNHLDSLARRRPIMRPSYDFKTHTRLPVAVRIDPAPVVVFDGVLGLAIEDIRAFFDFKVFVEVDDDLRFIRRLKRDIAVRGRSMTSVIDQYLDSVREMNRIYVEPSKVYADQIISWNEVQRERVADIGALIMNQMRRSKAFGGRPFPDSCGAGL